MKTRFRMGKRPPLQFLNFIFLQILSSAFLILPILTTIKVSPNDASDLIAYFSFASNFAIGFTKSVLITSLSLKGYSKNGNHYSQFSVSNFQITGVLVILQFTLSVILLPNIITTLLILHCGLLAMMKLEYRCQSKAISGNWKGAIGTYLFLITFFLGGLSAISLLRDVNSKIIIELWATSIILISLCLFIHDYRDRKEKTEVEFFTGDTRSTLAMDFLLNYGLMQLIYSVATTLTNSNEMIKYRLLMFLSIPTNIVMQALSTSGLTFMFGDHKKSKEKLLIFDLLASAPVIIIVMIFANIDSESLSTLLGETWSEIPFLLPYFLVMSLSAVFLSHTAMIVKWRGLTKSLLYKRILVSALQIPFTLFAIRHSGAIGILFSLVIFNTLFTAVNLHAIKRELSHES